jgi:hypothetical protein
MGVSGFFHAPSALPPRIEPPVPTGQEAEWAPEAVWTLYRVNYPGSQVIKN